MTNDKTPRRLFVTGIGTDIGKSWATGWLALSLSQRGHSVITQKFIQTGNHDLSEDIEVHRRIMGCGLLPRDLDHTTAPIILSYPASPDLAARIDGVEVDFEVATRSTDILSAEYDVVLIEGAGGIMVPLKDDYLTIDYIADHHLPAVVVTNGRLGSVSDTLLTLRAIEDYGIRLHAVVYNPYFDNDGVIAADTRCYLSKWVATHFPTAQWLEMPDKCPECHECAAR